MELGFLVRVCKLLTIRAVRCAGVAGGGVRKSNLGRPAQLRGSPPVNGPQGTGSICANCNVEKTPLWRKDHASGARLFPATRALVCVFPFLPLVRRMHSRAVLIAPYKHAEVVSDT